MRVVFFGPPGAGKGTIAARLSEERSIPHISTGELFREAIKNSTPLGVKVKTIIDSGSLVPDSMTVDLVQKRLSSADVENGFILDGFPRTIPQAEALSEISKIDCVLNIHVEDEIIVKRLTGRRICTVCGNSHHLVFLRPQKPGVCDRCGGKLLQREDDTEGSIRKRLEVYKKQTEPLIQYYRSENLIVDVDGTPAPEVVYELTAKSLSEFLG